MAEETIGKFQFSINMSAIFLFQEREQEDELEGSRLVDKSEPAIKPMEIVLRRGHFGKLSVEHDSKF